MSLSQNISLTLPAVFLLSLAACSGDDTNTPVPVSDAGTDASLGDAAVTDASQAGDSSPGAPDAAPSDGGADAGAATDAPPDAPPDVLAYPAFAEGLPQVRTVGGVTLAKPRIVPIVYAGDDTAFRGQILDFLSKLPATDYWKTTATEYGVTGATVADPVMVSDPAPVTIDDSVIQTWIAGYLNAAAASQDDAGAPDAGTSPWPVADGNSIYIVFYPAGTTVTFASQQGGLPSVSCTDFGAYHGEDVLASGSTPYAVIPRCNGYLGQTGINFVTGAASHELFEAATDPYTNSFPAYDDTDFNGSGWDVNAGGPEIGDLCKLESDAFVTPAGFGYSVQRMWSDEHAAAGHEPCVPNVPDAGPYFTAVPALDGVEVYPSYYVSGVLVAPGTSRTIEVRLASDAPTSGPWTVSAAEKGGPQAPVDPDNLLSFGWDKTTGQNGDVLHLTITRKATPSTAYEHGLPLTITSTLGGASNSFWTLVGE